MVKRGMTPKKAALLRAENGLEETKLQKMRVKRGISQSELSDLSGVTKRAIQSYEQGKGNIDNARLHTLCKLSFVLKCNVTDLIENKELIHLYNKVK